MIERWEVIGDRWVARQQETGRVKEEIFLLLGGDRGRRDESGESAFPHPVRCLVPAGSSVQAEVAR